MRPFLISTLFMMSVFGGSLSAQGLAIVLPENATYRYVNATPATTIASIPGNWFDFGFNDSAWYVGQGAFGASFGGNLSNAAGAQTPNAASFTNATAWSVNYDPYLRAHFSLAAPTNLTIWIAVDNGVNALAINGVLSTFSFNAEGAAFRWEHVIDVPAAYTQAGDNVIALQVEDHGGGTGFAMVITEDDVAVHPVFTTNSPAFPVFVPPTPNGQTIGVNNGVTQMITIAASDPQGQMVTLSATGAPPGAVFTPPLPITAVNPTTVMSWTPQFSLPTSYTVHLTALDSTGLSNQAQFVLNEVPFVDLSMVPGTLATTPVAPAVGQQTAVVAQVTNGGVVNANAQVSFYRGDPNLGGTLLSTQTGTIGFGVVGTVGFNWTPTQQGPNEIFVVVTNLTQPDNNPTNNRASIVVNVGAPPDQLEVQGGEIVGWPGATVQAPVLIRNTGAGPVTIAAATSSSSWVAFAPSLIGTTINPGGSITTLATVGVPLGTPGGSSGASPNDYTLPLNVTTATNTFAGQMIAHIYSAPVSQVTVRVVDATNNAVLSNSNVAVQGNPTNFVTNGAGEVVIPLPDGPRSIFAYHPGFIAKEVNATITSGATLVVVPLDPGQTLAVTQITSTPLTTSEALARGINPTTVANNVIYDFVVAMQIGPPIVVPSVPIPPAPGPIFTFNAPTAGGGTVAVTFEYHPSPAPNIPPYRTETWIIIPGRVSALKQFFEVSMYVRNQAVTPIGQEADVRIENTTCTLANGINLPSGLGLPDLNGVPQSLVQSLGTINAGESKQATWVIRGDDPGTYALQGSATGDLYAFTNLVTTLNANATSDTFNVVLPQLRLTFQTPSAVTAGQPFAPPFRVYVTNEQVVTASYVRVALKVNQLVNCHLAAIQPPSASCPTQGPVTFTYDSQTNELIMAEVLIGDIAPGETKCAEFVLISDVTGVVLQTVTQVWQSTQASPPVVVAGGYTGTGQDFVMTTAVPPTPLNGETIKFLTVNNPFQIHLESPQGTYDGMPFVLAVEMIQPGQPPSLAPHLFLDFGAVILYNGYVNPGFFVPPGGITYQFTVIPGFEGLSLILQAIMFDGTGNGVIGATHFVATDAHELRFIQ